MKDKKPEQLDANWLRVVSVIRAAGRDPHYLVWCALRDQVSPEVIMEGFRRTNETLEKLNLAKGELPPFESFAAIPPGAFDPRTFDQKLWWIDIWRNPRLIGDLDIDSLETVIKFCRSKVLEFCEMYHRSLNLQRPEDALSWLESTELMRSLHLELARQRT